MINIRMGTFETNSSSVHSMVLCLESDYQKWIKGELLLNYYYNKPWAWKHYDSENEESIEIPPQFVTLEQAAYYDKNYPYPPAVDSGWGYLDLDFKNKEGEYCERKFITFYEYINGAAAEFDQFEDKYITPQGEEVFAFGYFGYDR